MQDAIKLIAAILSVLLPSVCALATNGSNLIAVGSISRAMGGVGIADPQDPISVLFSNPSGVFFAPSFRAKQVDLAGTFLLPDISVKLARGDTVIRAKSKSTVSAIPAIGISLPFFGANESCWFGLGAYGVTVSGVDYRGTNLDQPNFPGFAGRAPLVAGEFTELQIYKFAPSLAYRPTNWLSIGLGIHFSFSSLDLGKGDSYGHASGFNQE